MQGEKKHIDEINWEPIYREAVEILGKYLQIDTSNPPGRELEAARFLQDIFNSEGIGSTIYTSSPERGNIVARLPGSGQNRPLILLNHMDVVPVESGEEWEVEPFSGVEKDGFIWGRGSLDMKGAGIAQLMAVLTLAREKISLARDIIFCATADEETGGAAGIEYVCQHSPEIASAECALNEGGGIRILDDFQSPCYWIAVSEKVPLRLRFTCKGPGGHGSIYKKDNPNLKLLEVLAKLESIRDPYIVTPTVTKFFKNMAATMADSDRKNYRNIKKSLEDPEFEQRFRENAQYEAMVKNTRVITMLRSGKKVNVVPTRASACVDCRLIPGISRMDFLDKLREYLEDYEVAIDIIDEGRNAPDSPADTPLYRSIERVAKRRDPGAIITPYMMTGGSDSSYLRQQGIHAYGFVPFRLTQEDKRRVHGKNERLSAETFKSGISALLEILLDLDAAE